MAELFDIRTYDYTKAVDILNIPDTWTPLVSVAGTTIVGKLYEVKYALAGQMADTNDAANIRWRINGGAWRETTTQASSAADTFNEDYFFPHVATLTTTTLEIEAQKTTGGAQFDIYFANAIIERKQ